MSPKSWAEWRAGWLANGWLHKGPDARRYHPKITDDQRDYAITLRRQLAERLGEEAAKRAAAPVEPNRVFWVSIQNACRREVTRCLRVNNQMARGKVRPSLVQKHLTGAPP